MRLFRSILCIVCVAVVALLYVHQQVELVRLSYAIDKKERAIKDIIDRKDSLSYNIKNLEAPSRLEKVLVARKVDMAFPRRADVFTVAQYRSGAKRRVGLSSLGHERKPHILGFVDLLVAKAEARE